MAEKPDGKTFTFPQKECLRLLKDYNTTFTIDMYYAHKCTEHDDGHACELAESTKEMLGKIKKEAEACGWTETLSVLE